MKLRSTPYIVIIDDNIFDIETEPLVGEIAIEYGHDNIKIFQNIKEGIDFINDNLSHKMIVLLDIMFGSKPEGLKVFEQVTSKTSLVYFILMTGNFESVTREMLVKLVNNHAWYFIKRDDDSDEFLKIIDQANTAMTAKVDGALEEWIVRHRDDERRKPYLKTRGGEVYSLNDLLKEIRLGTSIGNEFARGIINLAIDLLSRNKETI